MFYFHQKTAYKLRISDWSSDVCSSDLAPAAAAEAAPRLPPAGTGLEARRLHRHRRAGLQPGRGKMAQAARRAHGALRQPVSVGVAREARRKDRPERGPGAVTVPAGTADLCAPRRRRALLRPSPRRPDDAETRSDEHTSALQSLLLITYA